MYSDNRRSAFCESGGDKDKCYPYSILSKHQQQQQLQQLQQHQQRYYLSPQQPPVGQGFRTYQGSVPPQIAHSSINIHPPPAQGASFYENTMVTDVGICFSMRNVNLNDDNPPHLGHPSLSVLGKGYGDAAPAPVNNVPQPKYRSTSSAYKARNLTPPSGMSMSSSHSSPSTSPYSIPYSPYYFAYPKIPVKIYNNRAVPYVPLPTNTASSASAAAAYGQQLNSYFNYPAPPPPSESKLQTKFRRNASKNLMDNQYYDICMNECSNAMKTMLNSPLSRKSPPQRHQTPSPFNPAKSPIHVDVDDSFVSDEADHADDERDSADLPPLPDDDDDDDDENGFEEPQDFSMKSRTTIEEPPRSKDLSECSRRPTGAPKKKWIRQHMKDEPLVNGHSTAPPLVVISTNGSSSNSIISSSSIHQKHHAVSSLTIDLSTKSNSSGGGHRLSSTPPSSGCSSSSSTLTISPVDDSQSSLNLSGGSTSGYITSHSANSSSSLNLSGSSPLPINGSVIATSHGSNSSPLPHDLVIVQQQQQQQQQQISHLVQAGQPHHGLTSTATLLSHIPTGGRRRTTSSNSNGVGTREVHNKLEKNRRAHLKECFEQLKKQLTIQPDEKKTSNLSILHAAIRHIQLLKRKEREYEHEMERLAKEKIASQNRILLLKRELSQWGDVDFSRLAPDTDAIPNSSTTTIASSGVQSDRDLLNDPPGIAPGRNGIRYSSSSSLSSVATTASIGNLPLQTTISPVLIAASSPSRASPPSLISNRNSSSPAAVSGMLMPLSLTTKSSPAVSETHNSTPSPLKFSTGITSLPNGLNLSTSNGLINGGSSSSVGGSNCSTPNSINGGSIGTNCINGTPLPLIVNANNIGSLSQFTPVTATILTTGNGTALQALPLNLNVTSSISNGHHSSSIVSSSNGMTSTTSGLQIIGTTANGTTIPAGLISSVTGKELINGTTLPRNGFRTDSNKIEIIATQSAAGSALEPPATKVIKLVNGNTIDKMMLSQVVQQGGLVMSPIQLLTPQSLRVIQHAPNGLATIELSTPANVQPQSNQTQRTTGGNSISSTSLSHLTSSQSSIRHPQQTHIQSMTGAQLHKLLISSTNSSTSNGITTISSSGTTTGYSNGSSPIMTTTITPELARLPGGAELNILPAGTNGATALPLYRTTGHGGKLTFVNAISTGNGSGLTLKGADTSQSGMGRTAVHVVTPIQTSSAQLSGLTPVVVSRYDQDTGHMIGPFTTSTAGPQQSAQLGKVVKTVGQSPGGLPLIAATPNAQYLNAVFGNNNNNGNGGGAMMSLPPLIDGSGNISGRGTPSLVLVNSKVNSNQTPPPTAMVVSNNSHNNGEVTAAVAI
ncbi:mucin-6 isoform X2 [Ochlerotatus camptorhynchus]|uniref:mucin-6 isoform X2 n=1 Tax=Ochlerotatus camptorhynchus TaxID=644619 RepID=UPI0031DBF107